MRRLLPVVLPAVLATAFLMVPSRAPGYTSPPLQSREQLYSMYHRQLYEYPIDIREQIFYLEEALRADFNNPLWAIARIETREEHARYRALFTMHIHLRLIDLYLAWAGRYYKFEAYYYNYPWRELNIESLDIAEEILIYARDVYWPEAVRYSEEAESMGYIDLEEIQYWSDESRRIATGDLDYGRIISNHLSRLRRVRAEFEAMDPSMF